MVKSLDPVRILLTLSVFYKPVFSAFPTLVCRIANLGDIDLEFSGSISNVNVHDPAIFRDISIPRNCISLNTRQSYVFFSFFASNRSGKNFVVIPFVVPDILRGVNGKMRLAEYFVLSMFFYKHTEAQMSKN